MPGMETDEAEENLARTPSPRGLVDEIPWDDLVEVCIVTTDQGPWVEDVFFVLQDRSGHEIEVPQEHPESMVLVDRLGKLEGFDWRAMMDAMRCTENRRFVCWRAAGPWGVEEPSGARKE